MHSPVTELESALQLSVGADNVETTVTSESNPKDMSLGDSESRHYKPLESQVSEFIDLSENSCIQRKRRISTWGDNHQPSRL